MTLTFDEYQEDVRRTVRTSLSEKEALCLAGLGAAAEAGEVADLAKKHVFHDHPMDKAEFRKELGDVLWYLAYAADLVGSTLEEVAKENVEKRKARYPNGFDPARSMNRTEGA
jgi:NTP pyrophosphatase (non-canonical NTP hydrolase)